MAKAKAFEKEKREGEEIRSLKRKVIRVESEETQDYVKEGTSTEQEEEEKNFVPSAVSVPLKFLFRCDGQCSEKTLSYWQLASVVVKEGDEAYTTNLCQKCFNKHLQANGGEPLPAKCEVEAGCGKEGVSVKIVRSKAKKFRQLADEEKQAGIQGQWQQESPAREYLEQVKCCHDTDCNESMMKQGFTALKMERGKNTKRPSKKR